MIQKQERRLVDLQLNYLIHTGVHGAQRIDPTNLGDPVTAHAASMWRQIKYERLTVLYFC